MPQISAPRCCHCARSLAPMESEDKFTMANLDNLTEDEIRIVEQRYKEKYLPRHRLYALIPYNLVVGGFCIYYTLNFRRFSKKLFKPKKFGILELFKYGTIQSAIFVTFYLLGTCAVTGLWNPIQYVRDIAKIQGKIIDNVVK